jgi:hypothetical protein
MPFSAQSGRVIAWPSANVEQPCRVVQVEHIIHSQLEVHARAVLGVRLLTNPQGVIGDVLLVQAVGIAHVVHGPSLQGMGLSEFHD